MSRTGIRGGTRVLFVGFLIVALAVCIVGAGSAAGADLPASVSGADEQSGVDELSGAGEMGGADDAFAAPAGTFEDLDRADSGTYAAVDDDDTIRLTNELFLTDERGVVGVTTRVEIPDRVTELRLTLLSATGASEATIEADGFEPAADAEGDGEAWTWDGETDTPSITYAMAANETVDEDGPLAGGGTYRFVDAGEWALVRTPRVDVTGRFTGGGEVRIERGSDVDGEGATSEAIAFLGDHEEHVHEAAGQRFRLIVPDAADPVASPTAVFEALEYGATALQVGGRDDEVFAVTAPTDGVSWAVRGLQTGEADMWVRDVEPAGTADDVWTHEYVHTRQSYVAERDALWFSEGGATYYAALFALDRGVTDFDEFDRTLARGEREPDASAVLTDPDSWDGHPDYTKGALVAGEIDRQLRLATAGEASLATVFRDLNDAPDPVTSGTFLDAVEAAAAEGGDDTVAIEVRATAERLTTTMESPETWDREAHAEAFGSTPAQVGYGLAADGVRATGEYRDRPVERGPVRLVEGETLELTVNARNTGGVAGTYELSIAVDGKVAGTRTGTVEAGDEVPVRFDHPFVEAGTYEVRVGSETLDVAVSDPAPVTVRDVSVSPDPVAAGGSTVAVATVGNEAAIPGGGDVEFRVDGDTVATVPVRLDSGAERIVERELSLTGAGSKRIDVVATGGTASTTVTVEDDGLFDGVDVGSDDETIGNAHGFAPSAAVVALLATIGVLARRRG